MISDPQAVNRLFGPGTFSLKADHLTQPFVTIDKDDPFDGCARRLIMLFASRCGSSYLCRVLKGTGLMGMPAELFNKRKMRELAIEYGSRTANETIRRMVADHCTANGTFVVKSGPRNLALLYALREYPENFARWHFAFLTRDDVVRQAISIVRMGLTGQVHSFHEPRRILTDDDYDFAAIATQLNNVRNSNNASLMFLKTNALPYIHLVYEDFIADIAGSARRLGKHIGVDIPETTISPHQDTDRVGDDLTGRWAQRFVEDMARVLPDVARGE